MIVPENNQKQTFGSYGLSTIKSMASVMRVFGVAMLILMGFLTLFYLYGFMRLFSYKVNGLAFIPVVLVFAYIGCSIYMTLELLKASNGFRNYEKSMNSENLDLAFKSLNLYWRYAGILLLSSIALVLLAMAFLSTNLSGFTTSLPR